MINEPAPTVPDRSSRRESLCRSIAAIGVVVVVTFCVATVLNANEADLNLAFTAIVVAVLPLGWWAALVAPPHLRRFVLLAVGGLTCQVIGTALWYVAYLRDGSIELPVFGEWTPLLYLGLIMAAGAAFAVLRGALRLRDAALDCSIVVAPAVSVAFAVVEHHIRAAGWSVSTVDALIRPLVSLVIVVLISSAALGRWASLPLSVALVAIALLIDALGLLCASYYESRGHYVSDRWPDMLWCIAVIFALFAALTIISRRDRPLRLAREAVPGTSPLALVMVIALALLVGTAVVIHGAGGGDLATLTAGAAAVVWVGIAAMIRTTTALHETRTAYRRLDQEHFALEQERERTEDVVRERDQMIAQLAQRNVELTTVYTMLGPLLDIANDRSQGQLRSQLEDAADGLVDWLSFRRSPRDADDG